MSDIKDEGGPAFPSTSYWDARVEDYRPPETKGGMTLRDFFAAKAMQGLIASNDEGAGDRIEDIPGYAYAIADAMLKARQA